MQRLYTIIIILFSIFTLFANATTSATMTSKVMIIVKQQQYLAKKIAKDYSAFEADQKNAKKKMNLQKSIQIFNKNHHKLMTNKNNTKLINKKLTKVAAIWKIAYNLSQNKNHKKMLVVSMDDISSRMEELSNLYQKISK